MTKKLVTAFVFLLSLTLLFTGCPGTEGGSSPTAELTSAAETTSTAPATPASPFEGVWFHTTTYEASSGHPELTDYMYKLVINGTYATLYYFDDSFHEFLFQHGSILMADEQEQSTYGYTASSEGPLPMFYDVGEPGSGPFTRDGNTITITDAETPDIIYTGVLSEDGSTLTLSSESSSAMSFTKIPGYTPGPLEGIWTCFEIMESIQAEKFISQLVFFGNKYQLYVSSEVYLQDFNAFTTHPEVGELPDPDYSYPYYLSGTYSLNGSNVSLTNTVTASGMPASLNASYNAADSSITITLNGDVQTFYSLGAIMAMASQYEE